MRTSVAPKQIESQDGWWYDVEFLHRKLILIMISSPMTTLAGRLVRNQMVSHGIDAGCDWRIGDLKRHSYPQSWQTPNGITLKRFQIDEKHTCDACSLHLLSTTLRITFWDRSRQLPAGQIRSLPWTRDQCYHRQCRWHRQFPLGNPLHPSPGVSGAAWGSTRQGAIAVPWLEGCQHEDSGWFGHSFVLTFWRNIKRHQLVDFVDSSIENYPVLGHIQMHADAIHLLCPFLL